MGQIITVIVSAIVGLIAVGYLVVNLWPATAAVTSNVTAMTGTDVGTTMFKAMWPVILIIVAIVVTVGFVLWAVKKLQLGD